jgi:tetratricopeptide (TPR) repeat protein
MATRMLHLSASEQDQWRAYIQRGMLYLERGDYEGAVFDLEKGIQLGEDKKRSDRQKPGFVGYGSDGDRILLDGYKRLGTSYYARGDHARAKKMYTHVIENRPGDGEAYDNLGLVLESQGDYKSAISAYTTGIEKAPYDKLYYDRGCAYANTGDLGKALQDFAKVTAGRSPFAITAHFHEARVLEKLGMKQDALAAYRKVVAKITRGAPADRFALARPAILTQSLDKIRELGE